MAKESINSEIINTKLHDAIDHPDKLEKFGEEICLEVDSCDAGILAEMLPYAKQKYINDDVFRVKICIPRDYMEEALMFIESGPRILKDAEKELERIILNKK